MKNKTGKIEEIVDIEDNSITLAEVNAIAQSQDVQRRYEKRWQGELYSKLLMALTHEVYNEEQAKKIWQEIVEHMNGMNLVLGRKVGIAVAALDFLSNIRGKLTAPVIIEEEKSEFIAATATRDDLTGLYSREAMEVLLKDGFDEAAKGDRPLAVLMIDIDDFKVVNDRYGHQKGDEVLKRIGALISDSIREDDTAIRYGGEEFAVIVAAVKDTVASIAERIRAGVAREVIEGITVTVSIGCAEYAVGIASKEQLVESADSALYQAKRSGKNCVVFQ